MYSYGIIELRHFYILYTFYTDENWIIQLRFFLL